MSVLADLMMYGRFAWGLRGFLRQTITLGEAKAIVRQRLAEREAHFLRLVEKGIFGYPRSPYLPLLRLAQVELGDIKSMVRSKGLEGTLLALREAGVYVTFEEFKGREPIERDGQVFPVQARDFDNPHVKPHYYARSGGTTGPGTRVPIELDRVTDQVPYEVLHQEAHGLGDVPMAIWQGILPDHTGIVNVLKHARFGRAFERWFSPLATQDVRRSVRDRLANRYILAAGRLSGVPVPEPEPLRLDQAGVVAHWMAETLEAHGGCLLRATPSMALRVCIAAQEEGLDLAGATFMGGGEPPTSAKVRRIAASGASWIPGYWFTELGAVGLGCAEPVDANDLHLLEDSVALVQSRRQVPGSTATVDAFCFATLLPSATKLLLNVESDDYGIIEKRSCGCPWESFGYTVHVRHIRSFRKLTGEGVTLVGSEMVRILEEVLPERFGGSPLDYQLLEEEDEEAFTRLSLIVSPDIEIGDENEVIETVLDSLGQGSVAADLAGRIWSQAGSLRVRRMEPIWTARGKLMPLHMIQRSRELPHQAKRGEST
jgi:hypothetical protein